MVAHSLTITDFDYDRLNQLLDSPRYRATHAMHLHELRDELHRGQVVAATRVPRGVVTMNTRLRVRDLAEDELDTYTLVFPDEADIDTGKISVLAPLGTALLGTRAGDVVELNAPAGLRRLKVEKILYQPEAAGDFHL